MSFDCGGSHQAKDTPSALAFDTQPYSWFVVIGALCFWVGASVLSFSWLRLLSCDAAA